MKIDGKKVLFERGRWKLTLTRNKAFAPPAKTYVAIVEVSYDTGPVEERFFAPIPAKAVRDARRSMEDWITGPGLSLTEEAKLAIMIGLQSLGRKLRIVKLAPGEVRTVNIGSSRVFVARSLADDGEVYSLDCPDNEYRTAVGFRTEADAIFDAVEKLGLRVGLPMTLWLMLNRIQKVWTRPRQETQPVPVASNSAVIGQVSQADSMCDDEERLKDGGD